MFKRKKERVWRTFGEYREQREHSWSVESLLHAGGTYAPKSDSPPLRQSQNWESPYLFSSHEINNNILLWTKTLSVSLCLLVFSLLRSPFPPPPASPAFLFHCLDSYLYLCCSLRLPVCSYSHSQRLAVFPSSMNRNISSLTHLYHTETTHVRSVGIFPEFDGEKKKQNV